MNFQAATTKDYPLPVEQKVSDEIPQRRVNVPALLKPSGKSTRSSMKLYSDMDTPMTESATLLNAQLSFLDTHVVLIHIPLNLYPLFLQPIIQLILQNDLIGEDGTPMEPRRPWIYWHPFVNISITSNECSIVCPREYAVKWFLPILHGLDATQRKSVDISPEDLSVIAIGGPGMDAGARVLDLSSPLALAGISIFFITSYYSDYILVPYSARSSVIHALETRGFVFEAIDGTDGEAGHMANPSSPLFQPHKRSGSSASFDFPNNPSTTPPPSTVSELQIKTFKLLKGHRVCPMVSSEVQLVTCGGYKDVTADSSSPNFTEGKLQLGVVKCLINTPPPKFLSLTLTDSESLSVTLEKRLVPLFHNEGEDLLLGKDGELQVAITFDLRDLPRQSTGIVCGVASRLTEGMGGRIGREAFDMSYLSTAKAGHVIVYEHELKDAIHALKEIETG